jgi:thiosulfate/3-mercaptopyruvate sulfurtransferase
MANPQKSHYLTDVQDLAARLTEPELRIVDCRFALLQPGAGRIDYRKGHIPGAVYADLDQDLAAPVSASSGRHPLPQVALFARKLEHWGIGRDTEVVIYDQQYGGIAARLWWMLQWLGHRRATLLEGGFAAWIGAGLPLEQRETTHPPAVFVVEQRPGMVVSSDEILAAMRQGSLPVLVDGRENERFIAAAEPIDTVAGHIPGAVNLPFLENMQTNGYWLPGQQLRERWQPILSPAKETRWIAMCGSGVTACHLALSAQYAGFAAPQVYIGSWSEWIRDAERPREPR